MVGGSAVVVVSGGGSVVVVGSGCSVVVVVSGEVGDCSVVVIDSVVVSAWVVSGKVVPSVPVSDCSASVKQTTPAARPSLRSLQTGASAASAEAQSSIEVSLPKQEIVPDEKFAPVVPKFEPRVNFSAPAGNPSWRQTTLA